MSNHMQGSSYYKHLMASASAMALACAGTMNAAYAGDLPLSIEFGGQYETSPNNPDPFAPPFTTLTPTPSPYSPVSPLGAQRQPDYSLSSDGKISFQPDGSDWIFSAAVRFGRSSVGRHLHKQSAIPPVLYFHPGQYKTPSVYVFADTKAKLSESHLLIDFQAGKDVGIGLFGGKSDSTIAFGIRFAQLHGKSKVDLHARPNIDIHMKTFSGLYIPFKYFHDDQAAGHIGRSFEGVGPSISWNGSTPIAGNTDSMEINVDWGINGALLFGRQKAKGHHSSTSYLMDQKYAHYSHPYVTVYKRAADINRARFVVVPDVGGVAGLSFRSGPAKVSFGYRADFFLGAVDGGWDKQHSVDRNFRGPFASITIGVLPSGL